MSLKVVSLFSGAGGLDLGFRQAGFDTIWANEFDKKIFPTFEKNFPHVRMDTRSITDVSVEDIPDCDGIIGGPPCQSWSEAGAGRGIEDSRGKLFYDYIRILKAKQPKFFLAENVSGILSSKHRESFDGILKDFEGDGYNITWKLVNANDYGVPQDRERVIVVGYRKDLGKTFNFPEPQKYKPTLYDAIGDLPPAVPALDKNKARTGLEVANHEYMKGGFSSIFMSRNRVRAWDQPSFTILASARQTPLHPKAPRMVKVGADQYKFAEGHEGEYRRLSIRECARVQTFPDDFEFVYASTTDGYKMIGNAVPVKLAEAMAREIRKDLDD